MLGGARERSGRAGLSERGRVDDRGMLDVSGRGRVGEWTSEACWTCQNVGGFGVRMNMSMGVLRHSELVGARDGYRNMKLFGRDESWTIHLAHPVKY